MDEGGVCFFGRDMGKSFKIGRSRVFLGVERIRIVGGEKFKGRDK